MQVIKSINVKEQKPYEPPKLVRQGHVSQVTKKSGLIDDTPSMNSTRANASGNTDDPVGGTDKGDSGEVFDNFFDN